jgi:hypothetical protein
LVSEDNPCCASSNLENQRAHLVSQPHRILSLQSSYSHDVIYIPHLRLWRS